MQTNLIDTEEFLSYEPGSMKVYSTTYKKVETGGSWWWRDGMVTGNGQNGAILSCNPLDDCIIYNNMSFNFPTNEPRETPVIVDRLESVRQNMMNMIAPNFDYWMKWDYTFHPAQQLRLKVDNSVGELKDFIRWTDYCTAEVGTEYTDDNGAWERRTFASRQDNVVVTHLTSSDKGEKLNITLSIDDIGDMCTEWGSINTEMRYKCPAAENGYYIGQIVHYPEYENSELKNGGYATVTYIITKGGTKQRVENGTIADSRAVSGSPSYTIEVTDAEEIFLITKSDRTFDMGTMKEFKAADSYELFDSLISDIEAVCANEDYITEGFLDYDKLLEPHAKLHGYEFERLKFSLNSSAEDSALTNEELIAKQKKDSANLIDAMAERAFYAGRYSAVCCGGYSAPRLGGMWTGAWGAAWAGDWTTDANVNLQAAVMNIGNLPNSIDGYINFLLRLVDDWEGNATAIYGMKNALMAPPRTDSDRSTIYHYDNINPFEYWNAGSSWLLVPVYESYLCYGDRYISLAEDIDVSTLKAVLDLSNKRVKEIESSRQIKLTEEILMPLLTKTANFWEQLVDPRYYEDKDGNIHFDADKKSLNDGERYLILPSNSPENWTLGEYSSSLAINTTMDISAARYELEMACEIMELLKPKGYKDNIAKWTKLSEQLPAYKYDETGALREWAVHSYTENHAHRHISHTYAAWPAHESQSDAELQDGIATAITLRKATAGDKSSGHGWLHTANDIFYHN